MSRPRKAIAPRRRTAASRSRPTPGRASVQRPEDVRVGVVGAGIAGLTAALRLAQRGYRVTVYEARSYVGGQFGAHTHGNDLFHEHSFHMFLNWYNNFWKLAEDIGLRRERDFEPRTSVRYLRKNEFPRTLALMSPGSPRAILPNLFSGVQTPPDMFLYAYSLIDLLTQRFDGDRRLGECSVDAFMESRPYASEGSAALHELTLAKAFANPSYLTSARSYQNFIRFGYRHPEPMLWVLKGDCERHFHRHLKARLLELGGEIKLDTTVDQLYYLQSGGRRVRGVTYRPSGVTVHFHTSGDVVCLEGKRTVGPLAKVLDDERPLQRAFDATGVDTGRQQSDDLDYLILAIPPANVADILKATPEFNVETREQLGRIPRLESIAMASLDVYFKRALPGMPPEHVILLDSAFGLSFIDNAQAWPGFTGTALNVVAADVSDLAALTSEEAQAAVLEELRQHLRFDADDIDAGKTHFRTIGQEIFLNEVGSDRFRPVARTPVDNLFLAGDYCRTFVDVVTIEGAVVSGLEAARALQAQVIADRNLPAGHRLAEPIDIVRPDVVPDLGLVALKLAMAPYALAAKLWSSASERMQSPRDLTSPTGLISAAVDLMFAPYAVAADWLHTGLSAWANLVRRARPS